MKHVWQVMTMVLSFSTTIPSSSSLALHPLQSQLPTLKSHASPYPSQASFSKPSSAPLQPSNNPSIHIHPANILPPNFPLYPPKPDDNPNQPPIRLRSPPQYPLSSLSTPFPSYPNHHHSSPQPERSIFPFRRHLPNPGRRQAISQVVITGKRMKWWLGLATASSLKSENSE
jgi:hypothetical protein